MQINVYMKGCMMRFLLTMLCSMCLCHAYGVHIDRRILVVNVLVNKENHAVLPEPICEIFLGTNNEYSVEYKVKENMSTDEVKKIGEYLGSGKSPIYKFVNSDDPILGEMPKSFFQRFEELDIFCKTNATDYFATSINSTILDNGVYGEALSFVFTNTPPKAVKSKCHPLLDRLISGERLNLKTTSTNSMPIGSVPSKWF